MDKKLVRLLLWALVIVMMTVIFLFSCQNGEDTMKTSGRIAEPIANSVVPYFPQTPYEQVLQTVQAVVRKTAHFSEYTLLGCLICWLMMSYDLARTVRWAWLAGTLYACTDELHQLLGGERSAQLYDVAIDSAGALTGAGIAVLIIWLIKRRKAKRTV